MTIRTMHLGGAGVALALCGSTSFGQSNTCSAPTPLTLGGAAVAGTTVGATNDASSACDAAGRDVWYAATLPNNPNNVLRIEVCNASSPLASLAVYSACGAAPIACNSNCPDTACGACMVLPELAGGTYRIRVSDFNNASGGTSFTIRALLVPASADVCIGATLIPCPSTTSGSTVGATRDYPPSNCAEASPSANSSAGAQVDITAPGVWYRVTGAGSTITADTQTANYDTKLHVFTGSCSGLICVTANDDALGPPNAFGSKVAFRTIANEVYFILVSGWDIETGTFTLRLRCDPTPLNDACSAAQVIGPGSGGAGGTIAGATGAAFTSDVSALSSCAVGNVFPLFDVWYAYTAPDFTSLTLETCGEYDTMISIHSDCPTLTFGQLPPTNITCNNNGPAGCAPGSRLVLQANPKITYYVRVAGAHAGQTNGNFTLRWRLPCPADIDASGTVDVNDLLVLIGAWGPCAAPCPQDLNADNAVNVNDLLLLIGAWGACP